ncbi:related to Epsin-5 [Hanseniaspora guilliermondii]|uniref:Related to Epsin-5 n=1 Tax=Hanseniaspora guilliermondii TaxID=56406 RepID=A0A1L0B767_9ASCO|nr:related to Epsin-5 [Hanseniaspora guilliermondii]
MNIDKITKKISNLGLHDIKNAARFTQNLLVQYEPYQVDIRRATNTDEWGPLQKHLMKIIRHRYQVPMYLLTEYTLKRLVDHMANDSKNLYEKARKDYINYGLEYRVVLKCLIVIEWLILNSPTTKDLQEIMKCLKKHNSIFQQKLPEYKVLVAGDGKMEVHTRVIHNKNDNILMLMTDKDFLRQERQKYKRQQEQINRSGNMGSNGGESYAQSFDDEDEDEEYYTTTNNKPTRSGSIVDRQRSQRRQILREQIKLQEEKRKQKEEQEKQNDLIDLLSFDPAPKTTTQPKVVNNFEADANPSKESLDTLEENYENVWNTNSTQQDDEFGDFQTERSSTQNTNIFDKSKKSDDPFGDLLNMI